VAQAVSRGIVVIFEVAAEGEMRAEALGDIVLTLEEAGPYISANDEFWIELE
jgi:hypothetical protein